MRLARHARLLAAAGVALALLGGCVLAGDDQVLPVESPVICLDVPTGMCERVIGEVGRQAIEQRAVLVEIRIRCTSPAGCTDEAGELEYEARMSNGMSVGSSGYSWGRAPVGGGDPGADIPLPVEPICLGVDSVTCRTFARDAINVPGMQREVVGIVVACTGTCTAARGEGTTMVEYADGTSEESGWGYEGPIGP